MTKKELTRLEDLLRDLRVEAEAENKQTLAAKISEIIDYVNFGVLADY